MALTNAADTRIYSIDKLEKLTIYRLLHSYDVETDHTFWNVLQYFKNQVSKDIVFTDIISECSEPNEITVDIYWLKKKLVGLFLEEVFGN